MAAETLHLKLTGSATRDLPLAVDLDVHPGQRLAIIGSNGSGKTSILRLLAGLDRATRGTVIRSGATILTDDRTHLPPGDRQLPMAFAEPRLFTTMSVLDNLVFGAASADRQAARARAQGALATLGLSNLANRKADSLSSGQAATIATLRAVFARSVGVLMDEPFSALDTTIASETRSAVHGWLDSLPVPLVLATHSPLDVMALATHVAILADGVVVQHGPVDEVARRPRNQFGAAFLGLNLLSGVAHGTTVTLGTESTYSSHPSGPATTLTTAVDTTGPVWLAFAPQALTLHPTHPEGSAQNVWATTVATIEQLGPSVRITCVAPIRARIDVTPGAAIALGLRPGSPVWVSLKATGIEVYPA